MTVPLQIVVVLDVLAMVLSSIGERRMTRAANTEEVLIVLRRMVLAARGQR